MKTMNDIYRANSYVEFVISAFAAAKDSAIAVGSRWHMDSYVEVWVIQPSNIEVQ